MGGIGWGSSRGSRCLCTAPIHSLRLADPVAASPSRLSSICGDVTRAIWGVQCSTGGIMGVLVKWGISERSGMKSVRDHIFLFNILSYFLLCTKSVHSVWIVNRVVVNWCLTDCYCVLHSVLHSMLHSMLHSVLHCDTHVLHWLSRIRWAPRRPLLSTRLVIHAGLFFCTPPCSLRNHSSQYSIQNET